MSLLVTFNAGSRDFILDAFGKAVRDGFIVEKSNPDQKVLTPRGEEVAVQDLAGVRKGSSIFVKSDIVSLVEAAETIGA